MSRSAVQPLAADRDTHDSSRRLVGVLAVSATIAWSVSLMASAAMKAESPLHTVALILHILGMVLAFGAILLVDWLWPLMRRLIVMPPTTSFAGLTPGHRIHMISCLAVSQLCWWTAIIIGFVNAEF